MERIRLQRAVKLQYANPDYIPLYLDVVRPAPAGCYPIILSIFGGGWCSGDRSTLGAASHRLARAGYVVVSCDYRLAPAFPYPAAYEDINAAIQWILAHAEEFSGDASRLGAYGVSAGGHLVAMLATAQRTPLRCAVSWGGPMDLRHDAVTSAYRSYPLAFMGSCPHDRPDLYAEASPICRLSHECPPMLLVHGSEDEVVPIAQCREMLARAQHINARIESYELPGARHEPGDPRDPVMSACWDKILNFLATNLSAEPASLKVHEDQPLCTYV